MYVVSPLFIKHQMIYFDLGPRSNEVEEAAVIAVKGAF